jgi:hypothetical protein
MKTKRNQMQLGLLGAVMLAINVSTMSRAEDSLMTIGEF